jgi:hypothetical protein
MLQYALKPAHHSPTLMKTNIAIVAERYSVGLSFEKSRIQSWFPSTRSETVFVTFTPTGVTPLLNTLFLKLTVVPFANLRWILYLLPSKSGEVAARMNLIGRRLR